MLTGPTAQDLYEASDVITEASGCTTRFQPIPPALPRDLLLSAGTPEWFTKVMLELMVAFRGGGVDKVLPTFESLTGEQPRSLRQFAEDFRTEWAC